MRQPFDNPGAPTLGPLASQNLPSDRPVEKDQLPADRERGSHLGGPDTALQLLQEFLVAGGQLEAVYHEFSLARILPLIIYIVVGNHIHYCAASVQPHGV